MLFAKPPPPLHESGNMFLGDFVEALDHPNRVELRKLGERLMWSLSVVPEYFVQRAERGAASTWFAYELGQQCFRRVAHDAPAALCEPFDYLQSEFRPTCERMYHAVHAQQ
jgi:hypothetical protein